MKKIEYIPITLLHPHPDNPRKDLGDLTELAESIKAKGVLQNLTVVPDPVGGYRIIIGHRRHAAGKLAGLNDLPCVIDDMTPQEQFETMMVENVHRSDLTIYEQAEGFQMMLDMGGTVDEVAQKTGFSETTIRNRVKLLQLDRTKFHKAENRGGTMTDYLKLNAIQDPVRRNKVLDTIGTSEFNNALKREQENEQYEMYLTRIRAEIREQDWCRERTDENCSVDGDYKYFMSFGRFQRNEIKMPDDADTEDYIWVDHGTDITIYRKGDKVNPARERKKRFEDAIAQINSELMVISSTHLELRDDFIREFKATNTYEPDIEAFAAKLFYFIGTNPYINRNFSIERLGNLIGVTALQHPSDHLDLPGWNSQLFNRPQYTLLCACYTFLEGTGERYNQSNRKNVSGHYAEIPQHTPNARLDLIYEGLVSMGYEMSEEEIQMQNGTHPLFQKAQKVIDDYKKEVPNG